MFKKMGGGAFKKALHLGTFLASFFEFFISFLVFLVLHKTVKERYHSLFRENKDC